MKELVEGLEKSERVDWLLDTCFLIHEFSAGRVKELSEFCTRENVGMSSFNLLELEHVMHRLPGPISHHVRDFLKQRLVKNVEVGVEPGDREGEKRYVS
ncbi:TPA: hypothetical protein HA265_03940, partial [Candidatus Woesearchaeota archaeon]|nr:hypothetical protein [Candidatus Woesearchaeota archaeon]